MSQQVGQEAKDKGNVAFKAGNFSAAIGFYTSAALADPTNPTYPLNRAAAYLKLGKNEDAQRDCSTVLELDHGNLKALFRRGQAELALGQLDEARTDFERILHLDPCNDAARAELSKTESQSNRPKKTATGPLSPSSILSIPPKRRRIPITVVDSVPASLPSSYSTHSTNIAEAQSFPSKSTSSRNDSTSTLTFKEAKVARDAHLSKPGGGIFRSNGNHTIFNTISKNSRPPSPVQSPKPLVERDGLLSFDQPISPKEASPKISTPLSLFAFIRTWNYLTSLDERWSFLCAQIPPSSLPKLFQASMEASSLVSLLQTFREVLQQTPQGPDTVKAVKEYMLNLARVPRFTTAVLFLSPEERRLVENIWERIGGHAEDGSEVARRAWGIA